MKSMIATALLSFPMLTFSATYSLNFASLPSSQGWTYFSNISGSETSVFSLNNGVLDMNSTAVNAAWYMLEGVVDPTRPYVLSTRARVTAGGAALSYYVGFGGGAYVAFYLQPNGVWVSKSTNTFDFFATGDNTDFHDYVLTGSGTAYSLSRDSTVIYSGVSSPVGELNRLILGDGGSLGSGLAQVSSYTFTQSAVPTPSSMLLTSTAAAILAFQLRRRRLVTHSG